MSRESADVDSRVIRVRVHGAKEWAIFVNTYVLAVAMILSPDGPLLATQQNQRNAYVPAFRDIGVQWQLLDPRELDDFFEPSRSLEYLVRQLSMRYWDLLDAPSLSEGKRFPKRSYVAKRLLSNRVFQQELSQMAQWNELPRNKVHVMIGETRHLYPVWSVVKDAQHKGYYVPARRRALKQLRDLIGWEAFYRGDLPPHLPVWRIPEGRLFGRPID